MIEVKDIDKKFKDKIVLDQVNISIPKNSVTSILGPNGMGKTTLISIICNLLLADAGVVEYSDNLQIREIFLSLAGDKNLYMKNTVMENINYFSVLRGLKKEEILANLEEYKIYFPKFEDFKNSRVETLSFGQKKIVVILSALVSNSKLIILDEISEGLDMEHKEELANLIKATKKDFTYLLSSHDYEFISKVSDKASFLKDGKFVKEITNPSLEDIRSNYSSLFLNKGVKETTNEEEKMECV